LILTIRPSKQILAIKFLIFLGPLVKKYSLNRF
jgi:hypothetical protein